MIPNKLQFDLDLQDLPARANKMDLEQTVKLMGGETTVWECHAGFRGKCGILLSIHWGHTPADAIWACRQRRANCCTYDACAVQQRFYLRNGEEIEKF